ncbi:MAG: hypothetical protein K6F42_03655, partial [Bacteroidales bacterium]|nr:hypothetical protein [Bacteroidales bacterium]
KAERTVFLRSSKKRRPGRRKNFFPEIVEKTPPQKKSSFCCHAKRWKTADYMKQKCPKPGTSISYK